MQRQKLLSCHWKARIHMHRIISLTYRIKQITLYMHFIFSWHVVHSIDFIVISQKSHEFTYTKKNVTLKLFIIPTVIRSQIKWCCITSRTHLCPWRSKNVLNIGLTAPHLSGEFSHVTASWSQNQYMYTERSVTIHGKYYRFYCENLNKKWKFIYILLK